MRPLDLFIEKQATDGAVDMGASRAFSREANELLLQEGAGREQTLTARDKLALTTASMIVGSPFVLFGLGATFALFDELDFRRELRERGALNPQTNVLRKSLDLKLEKDKAQEFSPEASLALLAMDLEGARGRKGRKARRPRPDQALFSDSRMNRQFLAPSRTWQEVSKLAKRKQFLLDEIERVNKGQQLSLVSNLLSQIERLDKALKRLGS
ncbi:MAG TPA: hypothetical protein V6D08_03125 [Candidatus Obscuribacterales bacterium]